MKCVVCGTENNINKSKFCCKKCEQKYYYQINKQKRAEYKKEYYQTHKEECDARHYAWASENKEKDLSYKRKYYYKKKGNEEYGKNN